MRSKKNILVLTVLGFLMGLSVPAASSAIAISAECAYTADDLVCYVYVDTLDGNSPGQELRSGGVRLRYNANELLDPSGEPRPNVTKNEEVWYFGPGTQSPAFEYMDPDTGTDGEVVFIVGKLDTTPGYEGIGVSGSRVLIGTVKFVRNSAIDPGADPAAFFGISLELGRPYPYVNFTNVDGAELDGAITAYTTKIFERGDANEDGKITNLDMFAVRSLLSTGIYKTYADCNKDLTVTNLDMFCIRSKL